MEALFAFLDVIEPWHWWALAAILIGIEMLTPTFYFLWPGIAAALVGLIAYFIPALGADIQILAFAVLTVVCTVMWKRYAPASWSSNEQHPTLNRRADRNIGRQVEAAVDFVGGQGAVMVDDTRWTATSADGSNPKAGDMLMVTGAEGVVLVVGRLAA